LQHGWEIIGDTPKIGEWLIVWAKMEK